MKTHCFQIHVEDNVATLLDDALPGPAQVRGGRGEVELLEPIKRGHKVALREITQDEPVIKFGVSIGHATRTIPSGGWVHLHNCASNFDERSSSLDLETGVRPDAAYE